MWSDLGFLPSGPGPVSRYTMQGLSTTSYFRVTKHDASGSEEKARFLAGPGPPEVTSPIRAVERLEGDPRASGDGSPSLVGSGRPGSPVRDLRVFSGASGHPAQPPPATARVGVQPARWTTNGDVRFVPGPNPVDHVLTSACGKLTNSPWWSKWSTLILKRLNARCGTVIENR